MVKAGWQEWYEDTCGKYCKPLVEPGKAAHQYVFVDVTDMEDACGRDWHDSGMEQFLWDVSLVDIFAASKEVQADALRSCGIQGEVNDLLREKDFVQAYSLMADALHDYGAKAPLDSGSSRNFEWSRARGIRRAEEILKEELFEELLDKPSNKIGSTARDFMAGDVLAGLRRYADDVQKGERKPDCPMSNIMLHVYAATGGRTLGGSEPDLAAAGSNPIFKEE